jgi:serine protease inhibitor
MSIDVAAAVVVPAQFSEDEPWNLDSSLNDGHNFLGQHSLGMGVSQERDATHSDSDMADEKISQDEVDEEADDAEDIDVKDEANKAVEFENVEESCSADTRASHPFCFVTRRTQGQSICFIL